MAVIEVYPVADPSVLQILRQLCRALNPVKALRSTRASTPHSANGARAPRRRCGLQNSIEVLNIAFTIAETIPVVGPPLKGALEALCKILGQIERRFQNAEAAAKLINRLAALGRKLSIVENPDPILAELTDQLHAIRDELDSLMHQPGVHYTAIAQALGDFTNEIDSCLLDYIAVVQIQLEARTRVTDAERLATQCVQVIDPFGHKQLIPCVDIQNPKIVAAVILSRYTRNPRWHQALAEFVVGGMYELTMDDGNQIQSLTGAGLASTVSRHATVVMNIVLLQVLKRRDELLCPICQGRMPLSEKGDREVCKICDRRVSAIESKDPFADGGKQVQRTSALENLFRHILIRHTRTTSRVEAGPTIHISAGRNRARRSDMDEENLDAPVECTNCQRIYSSMMRRRDSQGNLLCPACGLILIPSRGRWWAKNLIPM